jgi:hypothetical protein
MTKKMHRRDACATKKYLSDFILIGGLTWQEDPEKVSKMTLMLGVILSILLKKQSACNIN